MRFLPFILFVAVFISPFLLVAESLPNFPFLSVVGKAEMEVAPDEAEVTFRILAFDEKADAATNKLNRLKQDINSFLASLAISEDRVESYNVTKTVVRARHRESHRATEVIGHELSLRFKITLADLKKFEPLISHLLQVNGLDSLGIEFDLQNRAEVETQLAIAAGQDAFNRAYNLAIGVQAQLGPVYSVREEGHQNYHQFEAVSVRGHGQGVATVPDVIRISKTIAVIYRLQTQAD